MEEKKNKGLIIALIILIILVTILGGYIVYDKVIDKKENTEEKIKNQNENKKKEKTKELKNYDINNIKNIEVIVPVLGAKEPETTSVTIDNKEEIKEILSNVDEKEKVGNIPRGVGFTYNVTITINREENPSTKIIIMNNGNVAINPSVGVAENSYGEYKIENKNLATELTKKYQKKE